MIDLFAKWTIILFGLFFICVGFLMLIRPDKAREILRKAGSTNFINYAEITIRIIPAVGLILSADNLKFPEIFRVHLKSQKHVRCEIRGFYDVQIVLQNTLNEADGVLLAEPNSRKQ
jgi:hypothetical protein